MRSGCVFLSEAALVGHVLSAGSGCLSRWSSPPSFSFWSVTVTFPHLFRYKCGNTSFTATSLKLLHYVLWFPYTLSLPLTRTFINSLLVNKPSWNFPILSVQSVSSWDPDRYNMLVWLHPPFSKKWNCRTLKDIKCWWSNLTLAGFGGKVPPRTQSCWGRCLYTQQPPQCFLWSRSESKASVRLCIILILSS